MPASAAAIPSPTPEASGEPPWTEAGTIDQQFTTPALEYRSTGTHLIWSSGARADRSANVAPDLFGSEPGGPVQLLYDNPNRDSRLELVGGDGRRVVFVESNPRVFGPGRWRMWYLADAGGEPELIAEDAGTLPFFDLSGSQLVFAFTGGVPPVSELWLLDVDSADRRLIASADAEMTQYWFPAIDGDRVVYGALERSADGQGEERHVYLLDLGLDDPPRRLDTSGTASQPDIRGDTVVWKESGLQESHLVAGRIVSYALTTAEVEPLVLDPTSDRYTFPSVGDRYVAAWSGRDRALYLADLEARTPLEILDLGSTTDDPHDNVGLTADLAGDLLAFMYGPAHGELELRWIILRGG